MYHFRKHCVVGLRSPVEVHFSLFFINTIHLLACFKESFSIKETYHTQKRCDYSPTPLHPGIWSVTNHLLNRIIKIISTFEEKECVQVQNSKALTHDPTVHIDWNKHTSLFKMGIILVAYETVVLFGVGWENNNLKKYIVL